MFEKVIATGRDQNITGLEKILLLLSAPSVALDPDGFGQLELFTVQG